jgi:Arc/MetJ-type ribon-helix-helix transcriptional regulator
MRTTDSQPVTVSLPASMLAELDATAQRLGATRSELIRAALRSYHRQLQKDEALLSRTRGLPRSEGEEALAAQALAARRARRSRTPV